MRVLVCGLGSIGRRHVRNLRRLGVSDIVCFRSRGRDTRPLGEDEECGRVPSLEEGLERRPDLVLVTNPTALHLETAVAAVRARVPVFVEKPLGVSLTGVDALLERVQSLHLPAFIGYTLRFHPTLVKAKQLLDTGAIGRPLTGRFFVGEYLPDFHPWEDYREGYSARSDLGGGVMLTLSHDVDLATWFFGVPQEVSGATGRGSHLDLDVEDVAAMICTSTNGPLVEIHMNYLERPARRGFVIVGEDGTMEWEGTRGLLSVQRRDDEGPQTFSPPPAFERNEMFLDEMRHVLGVLAGVEPNDRIPLTAGRDALAVIEAAKRSVRGRRPVPIGSGRDPFDLTGRVALVTGATGMLGREYVDELARAGAAVVVTDIDESRCDCLAEELRRATGAETLAVAADLTREPDIEQLVARAVARFGRIDVLVNNAAMNPAPGSSDSESQFQPFEDYPRDLWEREVAVNVTGPFLLTKRVGALMARAGSGVIVNVASTYGLVAPDHRIYAPGQYKSVAYAVTKSAILNFTRYLAGYYGRHGIRVNTLSPGGVEAGQDPAFVAGYAERTMLGRMARPHEYRRAILFLASDASSYMTGANLVVDGGWTAW
jgi:NAD(P)-dependent dehydrogenase (short-subunit alcohol dehydrogenase family)/predicted dehydrogenase